MRSKRRSEGPKPLRFAWPPTFPSPDTAFGSQIGFLVLGGFGSLCVLFGGIDVLRNSWCWRYGTPHEGTIMRMETFHGRNQYDRIFFAYPRNTEFPVTLQSDVSEEFYRRARIGDRIRFKRCAFPTETVVLDPDQRWSSMHLVVFGLVCLAASAWQRRRYLAETLQEPVPLRQIARHFRS